MKNFFSKTILLILIIITSCSQDENVVDNTNSITVITDPVTELKGKTLTFNGRVIGDDVEIVARGFAWSLNSNPTTNDYTEVVDGSGFGSFFIDIKNSIEPLQTYHVRAWVSTQLGETFYGNDLEFTTKDVLSIENFRIEGIVSTRVVVSSKIEKIDDETGLFETGYVFSVNPNPTLSNFSINTSHFPFNDTEFTINNLSPNTDYYIRPYVSFPHDNRVIYGEELKFKTVGYVGPSGGYVVFDKGSESDGWRFMEAAPGYFDNVTWGCKNISIPGMPKNIGSGYANSQRIINSCNDSNFAAKLCRNYDGGGYNNWFLPSSQEMSAVIRSLVDINALTGDNSYWVSNQNESIPDEGIYLYYNPSKDEISENSTSKGYGFYDAIPVRRYK
ncbi:hypothetical protein [uncultured Tenacibaculum sp.]|uniref:hypothetical protein n=1 Tax=uncultured Tenacibaculum sp. TaxID=174713 RepID=UPI0026146861|nr:hypothetical protein [uncultured Tenacibaculum sp.]